MAPVKEGDIDVYKRQSYSCAKTLTLEEGTYEISITAQGAVSYTHLLTDYIGGNINA